MAAPVRLLTYALTLNQYTAIVAVAGQHGIILTGTQGVVTSHDCRVAYNYDGAEFNMSVQSAPPFMLTHAYNVLDATMKAAIAANPVSLVG